MTERQPLFGRIVEALQNRYKANRISRGTSTFLSESEPVLHHLKVKGLRGIPDAFREERTIYRTRSLLNVTRILFESSYIFLKIAVFGKNGRRPPGDITWV